MVSGIGGVGNMVGSLFGGMDQMPQAGGHQKQEKGIEELKKRLEQLLTSAEGGGAEQGGGAGGFSNGSKINMPEMNTSQVNFM
ncbi:hypothetical protein [Pseudomonas sp. R76]|uniref:hypothetical protein n=1 Tax=Pseudomonas sp. R76 TaxID=1573711 RepID=UPI001359A264|nr:hypothetical protein [Pseudomonas sp. R76]